ncbi:divergent polysaccharide deacetylase family protein [Litoreibacter janthinus]|nr:divergent polysaccharide deacetylase family protein [Litoreibacter janthinus]
MVKGISTGLVSGGLVGVVVMSILSLYAPLPQDKIDAAPKLAVETQSSDAVSPEQTQSSAAPLATETPVVPASTESGVTEAPVAADSTAPETQTDEVTQPQQDAPVVQPSVPQLDSSSTTQSESPTAEIATSDATLVRPVPGAPAVPAQNNDEIIIARADPTPEPVTQVEAGVQAPTADSSPSVTDSTDAGSATVLPSQLPQPTVVGTEQPAVTNEAPARTSTLPTIGATAEDAPLEVAAADTPITLPQVDSGVVTNRLPSVGGGGASSLVQRAPVEAAPEPVAAQPPADLGALRNFRAPVAGIEGKSLFGVILIDSGEDGIPREDLMKLSVPVTIAIDPTQPDAAQIMESYRAAGIEVVAIANELPTASAPGDVAVAVEAYFNILNQAVGLMDPLDGRIQSNRTLLQPVLGAIRNSGHGLITYDRGLNTAQQAARREDIPAATVFRVLDADREESPKIKRYLDRAAFNANRDGAVVVVGRSYSETVKAIVEWVLEKKEAGVAMVPVSAVMLADETS